MQFTIDYTDFNYSLSDITLIEGLRKKCPYIYRFIDFNNTSYYTKKTYDNIKLNLLKQLKKEFKQKNYNIELNIIETINDDTNRIIIFNILIKKDGYIKDKEEIKLLFYEKLNDEFFNDIKYNEENIDTKIEKELIDKYSYYDIIILAESIENIIKIENFLTNKIGLEEFEEPYNSRDIINIHKIFEKKGDLVQENNSYKKSELDKIDKDLYSTINIEKLIELYNKSDENLLLVSGEPGTGKTSLIKSIFTKLNDDADILYTTDINVLNNEEFWGAVEKNKYEYLIIDDVDNIIKERQMDSNEVSIVNKLLTALDGIVRNKIKIIITTNLEENKIDSALTRSGRCFALIKLEKLKYTYAKNLWITKWKLDREIFTNKFKKDKNILQSDLIQLKKDLKNKIIKKSFIK